MDLTGKTLMQDSLPVEIPSRKSINFKTLDLQGQIKESGMNGLLTWLELEVQGNTVSDNLVLFALPKEYKLTDPALTARVDDAAEGFLVTVRSENPALWVWLGLENADARFSDNFVHLMPAARQKILVQPRTRLNKDDFIKRLQVRSLFDTYLPA